MRRPTRSELLRRWAAVLVAVVAVAALALTLAGRGEGGGEREVGAPSTSSPAADAAPLPTSTAASTTTTPTGRFTSAAATGAVVGEGPLQTYRVEVEQGAAVDAEAFGAAVEAILSDSRGWTTADGISLQRVASGETITVTLATPATVDVLCHPLDTDGDVSCARQGRAIINLARWHGGAAPSGLGRDDYRRYLVSHEVGHVLGHTHVGCPAPGAPAPVMMQQTLSIGACAPNPWPVPTAQAAG